MNTHIKKGAAMLRLIGVFKIAKSLALAVCCVAAMKLIGKDLGEELLEWQRRFHIAPGSRLIHVLMEKLLNITPKELAILAIILGAYSVMFMVEGIGLLLAQHWAEWMTVVTTCGLIPLEIYEVFHHFGFGKLATLVINLAVAVYLILLLRNQRREHKLNPS